MNKKALLTISLLTILTLTGCFGGDDEEVNGGETVSGTKKVYDGGNFTIQSPIDWETIPKDQHTSNVPSGTVVAFVNNVKSDRFTANVNVFLTEFTEEISPEDFAKSTMDQARNTLVNFSEGQIEEISIPFGEEESKTGFIMNFSGKKSPTDPVIQWTQLVTISSTTGFTVSGAYRGDESESVVNAIDEMVNSFALK